MRHPIVFRTAALATLFASSVAVLAGTAATQTRSSSPPSTVRGGSSTAAVGTTTAVSNASSGSANGYSNSPSLSGDGNVVAFESRSSNLVLSDANDRQDIFVRNLTTGQAVRVSKHTNGTEADGNSYLPDISADGLWVAFLSDATNLVTGDTNGLRDVFVHHIPTGTTSIVSVRADGGRGNGHSSLLSGPSISGQGRFIAFDSQASNFVPGDTNGNFDVFLKDMNTGTLVLLSGSSFAAGAANNGSGQPDISDDGDYVAFMSHAEDLVPGDTNDVADIFVRSLIDGTIERVSVTPGGTEPNGDCDHPSISGTGRVIAYQSIGTNLAPGDTNGSWDVFIRDRTLATTTRVTETNGGALVDSDSQYPSISASGDRIVFSTDSVNLLPFVGGSTAPAPVAISPDDQEIVGQINVYLYDRTTDSTEVISVGRNSTQRVGDSFAGVISGDGGSVAFTSEALLTPDDPNLQSDVFVRDLP